MSLCVKQIDFLIFIKSIFRKVKTFNPHDLVKVWDQSATVLIQSLHSAFKNYENLFACLFHQDNLHKTILIRK